MISRAPGKTRRVPPPTADLETHSSYPPIEGAFSKEDILAARLKVTKVVPFQQASPPYLNNFTLAVVSGLLLVLAFPNWTLWSLGWVGTAPLIMAIAREQRFWRAALLGWVTGTIFYAGTSHWITYSMHNYGGISLAVSYLLLVLAAAVIGSFTAVFAGVLGLAIRSFGGWAILSAPILWAASEWLRLQATGLGWNALGYSQAFQPMLIQSARFGGVYFVSAFLVAMSAAIVFSLIYLGYKRGWIVLSVALLMAAAVVVGGLQQPVAAPPVGAVAVIAVQPNFPIDGDWGDDKFFEQMLLRQLSLSEQGIAELHQNQAYQGEADGPNSRGRQLPSRVVIWPESPINFQYEKDEALQKRLAAFVKKHQVFLLLNSWGTPHTGDAGDTAYNSALLIGPGGERLSRYDKIDLMPFGEYVPARGVIPFMDRIPALVADTAAGKTFTRFDVADSSIGALICFEAIRPGLSRRLRGDGATALVQLSNESWFGPSSMARQMLAHAVFRAVENNVDVVRVTNSGASAQVTPYGDVLDETPMFQTATRLFHIKSAAQAGEGTFYTRRGDLFAVTCAVIGAIAFAASVISVIREVLKKRKEEEND